VQALGLVEKVSIGGHTVHLALPVVGSNGKVGAPTGFRGAPLADQLVKSQQGRWGYRSTQSLYYVTAASASFLLLPQEAMHDSPEFNALGAAFFGWFRMVQEWASVWSNEPLGDFDTSHNSAFLIPSGDQNMTGTPVRVGAAFFGTQPLSRAQMSGALRRASRGDRLPVEHRMLLSARESQSGGDLRRAVIDAATAAEVALASYVADHLRSKRLGPEFINEMIKDVNGLVNLHALCTKLGGEPGVSKNKVREELANIRNHAAHAGQIPSADKVDAARKHAEVIVRTLRPLLAS
jgi:hypothetical protein